MVKLTELPKFVRLLAEHSGQLVNYSQLGNGINVNHKTSQRYVGLLEQVFLVATVQPWFTNALKRIVKTPKLHFLDSGVLATTRGLSFDRVKADRGAIGALLETFVFSEVLKLMTASDLRLALAQNLLEPQNIGFSRMDKAARPYIHFTLPGSKSVGVGHVSP